MKNSAVIRLAAPLLVALTVTATASAQDSAPPSQPDQTSGQGNGQRGPGRGFGGGFAGLGGGLWGTVSIAGPDQYTIKTDAGAVYTVHLSPDTRIFKMPAFQRREGDQGNGAGGGQGGWQGRGMGGNPPQQLKPTDIKVGDVISIRGQADETAKLVPASAVVLLDPDRVAQMREMNANFGKTWLMGKVTAIDETKVTITGTIDNAAHTFVVDENTTFRKRRDPVTLADIQVGDVVRADGAVKDGVFTAASVNSMGAPPADGATIPRVPPQGTPAPSGPPSQQ
jgi:preprotein translocase subunit YajC